MLRIKNMYKLHSLNTANGVNCGSRNNVFYETLEEAEAAARQYCSRDHDPCEGIVIYRAERVVLPVERPTVMKMLKTDGTLFD